MAVACSETCARDAIELHEVNQRGKKLYGIGIGATNKLPSLLIFYGLFTIFVLGTGVFSTVRDREIDYASFGFGTILVIFSVITYRRNKDFKIQMWILRWDCR